MSMKLEAEFVPQAWIRDNAVEVDPEGEVRWDCTAFLEAEESHRVPYIRAKIREEGNWLDVDDLLKEDPAAPEWVQDWTGPFSIYVREVS
jgi:hypothetical protein